MKKAFEIVHAAKESVGYAEASDAVRLQVESILSVAELLSEKIEQIEVEMARLISDLDEAALILSIPGIGEVTAAAILGEIGGFCQYENPAQIRKLAGLDLVGSQSGNHQSKLVISKRGRKLLRKVLYQAAVSSLASNDVSIRFYHGLIEPTRPNRLKKKQALVAVAGKLIEIMFAVVRTGKPFEYEHEWTRPGQVPEDMAQAA
jgi:transposase